MANEKTFKIPYEEFAERLVNASESAKAKYMLGTHYTLKPLSINQKNGTVIFEVVLTGPQIIMRFLTTGSTDKLCKILFDYKKEGNDTTCTGKATDWVVPTYEYVCKKHANSLIEQVYKNLL